MRLATIRSTRVRSVITGTCSDLSWSRLFHPALRIVPSTSVPEVERFDADLLAARVQ